jgi:outer membrane protein assembly factor BamC
LGLYYINVAEKAEKKDESVVSSASCSAASRTRKKIEARAERYQVRLSKVGDNVQVTVEEEHQHRGAARSGAQSVGRDSGQPGLI